ncbi:MAG: hypothetical protein ACTHN5_06330, partial [Phycisphaerae bacterium]
MAARTPAYATIGEVFAAACDCTAGRGWGLGSGGCEEADFFELGRAVFGEWAGRAGAGAGVILATTKGDMERECAWMGERMRGEREGGALQDCGSSLERLADAPPRGVG